MAIDWSRFTPIDDGDAGVDWSQFSPIEPDDGSRDRAEMTRFESQSAAREEANNRPAFRYAGSGKRKAPAPAPAPEKLEPAPYQDRQEAIDDALNYLDEGASEAQVIEQFGKLGITAQELRAAREKRLGLAGPPQQFAPVEPSGTVTPFEPSTGQQALDVAIRGKERAGQAFDVLGNRIGTMDADTTGRRFVDRQRRLEAAASSTEVAAGMQEIGESNSFGGAISAMARNPVATLSMIGESVIASTPALATAVLGSAMGPAGTAAGAGAGSLATEYANSLVDYMLDKGMNPYDAAAVARTLNDPVLMGEARGYAVKRGVPIAAFDALSGGMAGRFMGPAMRAGGARTVAAAAAKEAGAQIGAGMAGEAVAQDVTGQFRPADIVLEGLAELPGGVVEAASNVRNAPPAPVVNPAREIIDRAFGPVPPAVRNFTEPDSPSAQAGLTPIVVPDAPRPTIPALSNPVERTSDAELLSRVLPADAAAPAPGEQLTTPSLDGASQPVQPVAAAPDFSVPAVAPAMQVAPAEPAQIDWDSFTPIGAAEPAAEPVAARPMQAAPSPLTPSFETNQAQPRGLPGLPAQPAQPEPVRGEFTPARAAAPEAEVRPGAETAPAPAVDIDGARASLRSAMGPMADRVELVTSDQVGADIAPSADAYYDPAAGRVVVIEDRIKPEIGSNGQVILDRDQRRTWVAWHEAYHQAKDKQDIRLGRVRNAEGYTAELTGAATNPIVGRIAGAIQGERKGLSRGIAIEEALVELAAAQETGRYDEIADRYGVEVTPALQRSIASSVKAFAARVKRWLADTFGFKTDTWSDSDVFNLLRSYRKEMGRVGEAGQGAASESRSREDGPIRPYEGAPDALLGFRKNKPNKPFAEQRYPHVEYVRVTWDNGDSILDAMRGLNQANAMERARRNWNDAATVERVSREEMQALDPDLVRDTESQMQARESRGRSQDEIALDETGLDIDALNAELQMSSIEVAEEVDVDQYEAEFQRMMQRELEDVGESIGRVDELDRLPTKKLNFLTGTQTDKPIDLYKALPKEVTDRLLKAWRDIAKKSGAFRFARGAKKAITTFGKMPYDTKPMQQLADSMKLAEASRERARPGQATIERIEVKKTSPDVMVADSAVRVVFHMSDGTRESAELWFHTDDDYDALGSAGFKGPLPYYTAHTSSLPANSGLGTYFYQLVFAYADRTGIPVMPDTGLTTINAYRRTEQMISAALRSGNPMAAFPGKRQEVFGWKEMASPEEADRNMVRLLIASARNAQATAPEIVDMVYDPQTDTFAFENGQPGAEDIIGLLTAKGNVVVDKDTLRVDLDRKARELGVPPARVIASNKRGFGRDTYARAVLSQMIVDGKKPKPLAKPILYATGRPQPARPNANPLNSFDLPDETRWQKTRRVMQDNMLRLRLVQETIESQGGVVGERRDAYRAEERMHGRIQSTLEDFKNEFMRPLMQKVTGSGLTLDELALYAYAKHAPERNAYIQSINPAIGPAGSGMSNRTAAGILQRFQTEGKTAALDAAHQDLMAATEQTRRLMLDQGLIDQDTYDNWTQLYSSYIPLRGFENITDEGKPFKGAGRGINIRGEESMKALGRNSRAANLIENVILDFERAVIRGERNAVGKVFLDLVTSNPDPGLWEVDADRTTRTFDKNRGLVVERRLVDKGPDTIGVKVNGQVVYIKIKDELLARALRKGFLDESGDFQRVLAENLGWYTNWLRNTLTRYNPAFMLVNSVRDFQTGVFSTMDTLGTGAVAKFARHYATAMGSAYRSERGKLDPQARQWDKWFKEYRDAGGITGGFFMRDLDAVADELRAELLDAGGSVAPKGKGLGRVADAAYLKVRGTVAGRMAAKTVSLVEMLGSMSENMTRVAAYRTAREMGRSPAEAASIAKNLTTNFNRKGEIGTGMSALYLFYNAAVQGSTRTLQALKKRNVQVAMAAMTGFAMALALGNADWGGEDDDGVTNWDKIPDFEKERNLIIMLPPKDGRAQYIKIPMAYGFNVFPVLGNALADTARYLRDPSRGKPPTKSAANMVSAVFGSFNPLGGNFDPSNPVQVAMAAAPTVIDLPINLATETDTFGRTAASPRNDYNPRPDSERFFLSDAGTVQQRIARWLNAKSGGDQAQSGSIDITPATIETTVKGATGGVGKFIMDVMSTAVQTVSPSEDVNPRNIPFFKSLYGKFDEKTTAAQFYDNRKEIEDRYKQLMAAMKLGIKVDLEDPKNQAIVQVGKHIDATNKYMTDLRKWELRVIEDDTLSEREKKDQRKQIAELREGLMKGFNKEFQKTWGAVR